MEHGPGAAMGPGHGHLSGHFFLMEMQGKHFHSAGDNLSSCHALEVQVPGFQCYQRCRPLYSPPCLAAPCLQFIAFLPAPICCVVAVHAALRLCVLCFHKPGSSARGAPGLAYILAPGLGGGGSLRAELAGGWSSVAVFVYGSFTERRAPVSPGLAPGESSGDWASSQECIP